MKSAISSVPISPRKNGQSRHISRCSSRSPAASAVPAPYQDGSSSRFWVHAKTHGIARSDSTPATPLRDGGREPMLSCESSAIGAACAEEAQELGVVVDQPAVALARALREPLHLRAPLVADRRVRQRGRQQDGADRLLQRALGQLRVGVAGGHRLALLGDPDPPVARCPRAGPGSRGRCARRRATASRRGRGRARARRPASARLLGQLLLGVVAAPTWSRRSPCPCRSRE